MIPPTAPSHPKRKKSGFKLTNCDTLSSSDLLEFCHYIMLRNGKYFISGMLGISKNEK